MTSNVIGTRTKRVFAKHAHDRYETPLKPTRPLLRQLPKQTRFAEPCCASGRLISHLEAAGHVCVFRGDIDPPAADITFQDACTLTREQLNGAQIIVTNLPWSWQLFRPIWQNLISLRLPMWNLQPAGFCFNRRTAPLIDCAVTIVPVPRVKWIEGSDSNAERDCCWVLYDAAHRGGPILQPRRA